MAQLTLFTQEESNNNNPLPLIVADKWGFPLQYHLVGEEYYFSVQDWISGLTHSQVPRKIWTYVKNQLSSHARQFNQMSYKASNGKTYQMDFATEHGLYLIAEELETTQDRQALSDIKAFLAKSGVFANVIRTNPLEAKTAIDSQADKHYKALGKDEAWIEARKETIVKRNVLTAVIKTHVNNPKFGVLTDAEYVGLFDRTAQQLKDANGNLSPRDGMTSHALHALMLAEATIATYMETHDTLTMKDAINIIRHVCELINPTINTINKLLGIDTATGQKLLK